MTIRPKPFQQRTIWTYLAAGFIAGLVFWLIFFLGTNFYMFADVPGFVPRYLIETIVERPHVPMRFGLAGLSVGVVVWGIGKLLFKDKYSER